MIDVILATVAPVNKSFTCLSTTAKITISIKIVPLENEIARDMVFQLYEP